MPDAEAKPSVCRPGLAMCLCASSTSDVSLSFFDGLPILPTKESEAHGLRASDFVRWVLGAPFRSQAQRLERPTTKRRVAQVSCELECWDGTVSDSQGRRAAPIELLLGMRKRVPFLSYLARRPAHFPTVFSELPRNLEAGLDGWYEPVPVLAEDGPMFAAGFQWHASAGKCSVRFGPFFGGIDSHCALRVCRLDVRCRTGERWNVLCSVLIRSVPRSPHIWRPSPTRRARRQMFLGCRRTGRFSSA